MTIKGDLKSFEFYFVNKGVDITINDIYNNKQYEELDEQLEEFANDNEFMFNGIFYPYVEENTLKLKVTFIEDYSCSNSSYGDEFDRSGIVTDFFNIISESLEKRLGTEFDLDNLELQMAMESDQELCVQLDSYSLIYSVPESEELINLTDDKDLKMAAINYFQSWSRENRYGSALLGEELDYSFSILIEESYLSNFIEFVYDIINLNITD